MFLTSPTKPKTSFPSNYIASSSSEGKAGTSCSSSLKGFELIMGGRGRSRTQRKHFRESRENVWKKPKPSEDNPSDTPGDASKNGGWQPFATQNPSFDEYYKEQKIVSPEEWDTFIKYIRQPLPAAFRINSSSQFYLDIRSQLENDFMKTLQAEDADGIEVDAIKPLPWYPDNLAWQSNFSRNQLRKNQTLERFHQFLKLESEIGNITRQEAVSMIPPLFLDVRPDHFVLDMCAAPGSKTFQLLEMIHLSVEPGTLPTGMVMANDLDVQRCNLLIHQTKRMSTANLIVTNHEAQHFPSCHSRKKLSSDSQTGNVKGPSITQLQFDRVLCDVPCSGDGTLRKAPDIWKKWTHANGNGLHGLQVQIAMRGLALLKDGGRMVYSTCSMNPVENEAVVAEVLRRCGGAVELVDVSAELPQLIRRPGLKEWKVRDKGQWFATSNSVPKYRRSVILPGMFPSGKPFESAVQDSVDETATPQSDSNVDGNSETKLMEHLEAATLCMEAEVSDLPLDRCMRIVPHDQNSGSFFIAVLHKISTLPAAAAAEKKQSNFERKMDAKYLPKEVKEEDLNGDADNVSTVAMDDQIDEPTIETTIENDEIVGQIDEPVLEADIPNDNQMDEEVSLKPEETEKDLTKANSDVKTGNGKRKLQIQGRWRGVDPVIFYNEHDVVESIMDFYGIKDSFPLKGRLITRHNDMSHVKRIYYISDSVKEVLDLNLLSGQQLKIASVGIKIFERQSAKENASSPCIFRISSEGLPLILPQITKQILYASAVDFKHLLQYKTIKFQDFVDPGFGEKASSLALGCCVVVLRKEGSKSSDCEAVEANDGTSIAIGCWRGRTNVAVMVAAIDCEELLERLSVLKLVEEAKPEGIVEDEKIDGIEIKEDSNMMSPVAL